MSPLLVEALKKSLYVAETRPMGVFLDMPEAEYHAVKAFSYSGAKEFFKSPAHFQAYQRKEWEVDPDREKFKAVHLLCLEEHRRENLVVRDGVWRDKLKAEVQELQKAGKLVLKQKDLDDANVIAEKIKAHALAGAILSSSNTYTEVSLFWIDERTGVYCKARIDSLTVDDELTLGDLKNFGSLANDHVLWKQITDSKYHWQMAHYDDGLFAVFKQRAKDKFWIFVEDKDPFGIKVRTCTDPMIERAKVDLDPLLPRFKECEEDKVWPCYPEEAEPANLTKFGWEVGNE